MCKACESIESIDTDKVKVDNAQYIVIINLSGLMEETLKDQLRCYLDSEVIKKALRK